MRILIHGINYAPELTGIGKYTGEMAAWLAARGHDLRVVTAPPYYPEWKVDNGYSAVGYMRECIAGVSIWRSPLYVPSRPSGLKRLLHLASFASSSLPVMVRQLFWRPDMVLVIVPSLFCAPSAWLVARLTGGRCWLHIQDFEVDAAFDLALLRAKWLRRVVLAAERWVMRRFDTVSTISRRMLQRLEVKGVEASQRVLFPNWVDAGQIHPSSEPNPFRDELGMAIQDVIVLYSGNMGQKQGLEIIIGAAQFLATESNVRFIMCGQGAAYARLRQLAEGIDNIKWLPLQPIDKLNELLNAADIHLLPQRADAADLVMPSKLTGILASGRPVVATAHPGTEVWNVIQGRGITVEPENVEAFAGAIQKLAADAELRKSLGMAAREYAVAELDKEKVLSRFETELIRLVKG